MDISKIKNFKKLDNHKFKYVINLGGYVDHINKSKVEKFHFIGVKISFIILKKKLKLFIQVGSSLEYGNHKKPHKEISNVNLMVFTERIKNKATKFLMLQFLRNKFPVSILRLYQVYGPNQDFNRFIPQLIKSCIEKNPFQHPQEFKKEIFYIFLMQ